MAISIELIDEMRKRTNCSYAEAKELLEKHNGNLLEAIVEFEKINNTKAGSKSEYEKEAGYFGKRLKNLIVKGFKTRFIIEKSGETIINLSVILMLILLLSFHVCLILGMIVLLLLGFRFKIRKANGDVIDLNRIIDSFGSTVKENTKEKSKDTKKNFESDASENRSKSTNNNNNNNDDDGYREITVE